ncbi:uncharacterized protein [Asterias amurensis]|uniref:uncharacterized protein isoform X2 n=1 Tax=Asterias amurensis TaxID=7602 RepID=UPI003AB4E280
MISDNKKELHEADKLFKKLIAPGLRSFRLDSHVHQHYGLLKIDPVLLPFRSSTGHGALQASKTPHSTSRSGRTPLATEIMFDESFPKIGGQASSSAVEFGDGFYAASGLRGQQHRIDTSLSSASCTASVPWTFYSTTKMKQLPLPQVQSSEVLGSTASNPRGKKNVSVCSDRYLGTSRVGQQQLHRRSRSAADVLHPMSSNASSNDQVRRFEEERIALLQTKSLRKSTEVMAHRKDRKYHMCGSGLPLFNRYLVDSEEMDRLRQLTKARSTKRGSSPVSYYGGFGGRINSGHYTRQKKISSPTQEQNDDTQGNYTSQITTETNENEGDVAIAVPISTNDIDRLEGMVAQLEDNNSEHKDQNNTEDKGSETCNDDRPDVLPSIEGAVPSLDDGVIPSSEIESVQNQNIDAQHVEENVTVEEEKPGLDKEDEEVKTDEEPVGQENEEETGETREVENMMPNVKISRILKKKPLNGKDAFLTEFNPAAGDTDIEDMFGNFKDNSSSENPPQAADSALNPEDNDTTHMTAEEALTKMLISDDQIAAMEDDLKKISLLKGGMEKVGHLEESRQDLEELKTDSASETADYGEDVFGKVRSDEELKEIERRREKKQEERRAKSAKKAEETIVSSAKVSQAKSKMAEIYNFISSGQQEVFEKKFEDFDTDGNGVISLQELFSRMYRGKDKETARTFMQVFDLNKDKTIEQREFVIVAALNDKLTGRVTDSLDAPLELDLEMLAQHITAYKELFEVTDQDADGRLTLEDIMLSIALSGNIESGTDPEVVKHVHNTIDADDSGTIDFMEFLTYIPFFLKLHKRMVQSRHITIAEIETARKAVKKAVLKIKTSSNQTMIAF